MQKVIGAVLVILSGVLLSLLRVLSEKEKLENLKEMQKALFYMKQEIGFSGKTLPRIIKEIASRTEGEIGSFFSRLGEELINDETVPLPSCFSKVKREKAFLPEEAECVISDFFKSAGTFSGELESEHLDRARTKLSEIEKEERERFLKNKKLVFTLGICASFSVVMILV